MHLLLIIFIFAIYYITGGDKSDSNNAIRKKQVIMMGFSLFLFASLRSFEVGQDLPAYFDHYQNDSLMSINEIFMSLTNRDPVFHILLHFLSYIYPNPQLMLVVVSLIVSFGFSFFVYHEKGNVLMSFMMFIGFRLFSFTLSGLRQAIALGIVFVAYIYLKRSKYIIFTILTIIAALFHTSAILFIMALPASKANYRVLSFILLSGAAINIISGGQIARVLASLFFEYRFTNYSTSLFEGTTTFLLYIIIYIYCLLGTRNTRNHNKGDVVSMNMFTIGIFFSFIGQQLENVFRIAYYFIYAMYPVFSQTINIMYKNDKQSKRVIIFIVFVLLAVQYLLLGTGAGTNRYTFFWEVSF